ncbi:MAG: hypothetical protein ACLSG8_12580 [Barnesiella sp.]
MDDFRGRWCSCNFIGRYAGPFIGFNLDEDRLYGNSGCNLMMGAFSEILLTRALSFWDL